MKKYLSILFLLIPILALAGPIDWQASHRTDNKWDRVAIETTDEGEFTRGGNVLCTDADLVVQTVGANNRCFEEVGSPDLMGRVEPGGQNLIQYSHELGTVASSGWWTNTNLTSVTANGTLGPFGTTTADGLVATVVDTSHGINNTVHIAGVTQNDRVVFTAYGKPGNKNWMQLNINFYDAGDAFLNDAGNYYFNIATGAIGTKDEIGNATIHDYLIEKKANGFYRIGILISNSDAVTAKIKAYLTPADADTDATFAGDATTVNTWLEGADLKIRDTFDNPVVTSGSTASRIGEGGNPHYDIPLQGGTRVEVYDDAVWVKTDPNGVVFNDGNLISIINGDRDEDYYYTRDMGAGAITDFTGGDAHWVDVNVTALTDNSSSRLFFWALSNSDDDLKDIDDLNGDAIFVRCQRATATSFTIRLLSLDAGTITSIAVSGAINVGTKLFVSIVRSGTSASVEIYSSAALRSAGGSGDVDTIGGTVVGTAFRYVYGIASYNDGTTGMDISGTIENLRIGTPSEIFETKLGQELASGTLVIGDHYKITADAGNHFYAGSATGEYFTAAATTGLDGTNKVREVLNAGGVPVWTMASHIRPGFNEEDVSSDGAFISYADQVASALYHDVSGNGIAAHDGTSEATYALAFDKGKTYLMATQSKLNSNVYQFRVCADDGAGGDVACGAWANYDNSMDVSGDEMQFGYGLQGPFHSQWTMIDTRVWALHELRAYH